MQRREFISLLGGTAAAGWPLAARGQQPAKMKRIAFVSPSTKVSEISVSGRPYHRAFFEELSRLGYVEGQNLGVERYSGEGWPERYAELAREVVNTHPDLILTSGARLSLDFKMATTTIPVVTAIIDPIAMGLVVSIARPGGKSQALLSLRDWNSLENVWSCWSRWCQNCPPSITLYRDHTGKIQEVRQRERRPSAQVFSW
jgi:putative ABC transport system substrate-binding protein